MQLTHGQIAGEDPRTGREKRGSVRPLRERSVKAVGHGQGGRGLGLVCHARFIAAGEMGRTLAAILLVKGGNHIEARPPHRRLKRHQLPHAVAEQVHILRIGA